MYSEGDVEQLDMKVQVHKEGWISVVSSKLIWAVFWLVNPFSSGTNVSTLDRPTHIKKKNKELHKPCFYLRCLFKMPAKSNPLKSVLLSVCQVIIWKPCQIQLGEKRAVDSNSGDVIDKSPLHWRKEKRASGRRWRLACAGCAFLQPLPVLEIEKRLHSNNNSSN